MGCGLLVVHHGSVRFRRISQFHNAQCIFSAQLGSSRTHLLVPRDEHPPPRVDSEATPLATPAAGPTVEVRKPTQRSAHVRGVWREHIRKNPNREWLGFEYWWSWRDLNPRPQAFFVRFYMRSQLI